MNSAICARTGSHSNVAACPPIRIFPNDPDQIRAIAAKVPELDGETRYPYKFRHEAFHEVVFNLSQVFLPFLFPKYDADKYYHPLLDYISYVPGLLSDWVNHKLAKLVTQKVKRQKFPILSFADADAERLSGAGELAVHPSERSHRHGDPVIRPPRTAERAPDLQGSPARQRF